jgi:hypothetical protein
MKALAAALALCTLPAAGLSQRIAVARGRFEVAGKQIWISGANTPWKNWNDFGGSFDAAWWRNQFHELAASHVNATRVWISCNGQNRSPGIDPNGRISPPTSKFWQDLDQLFAIARSEHVYVMTALISFDHRKAGNVNADRWVKMYANPQNRESFVDSYVVPLIRRYRDNPWFWAVDVGNELDWMFDNQHQNRDDFVDLVARVANAVHRNSKVLVCQGMGTAAKYISAKYQGRILSDQSLGSKQPGAHVDFYNIHYYDWVKRWFGSPYEVSPSEMGLGDKPCIIGETPAKGSSGQSILQNWQNAFAKGWQGIMPWTSNGVDSNGSLADFKNASESFFAHHPNLVRPTS